MREADGGADGGAGARGMRLRPWTPADCEPIYHVANDPAVRAVSFSPAPIPWEEHAAWFARTLAADAGRLFVVDVGGAVAGYVRCTGDGVISVALATAFRGRGLAVPALAAAVDRLRGQPWREIRAFIKPDNAPSLRAFAAVGFREAHPAGAPGAGPARCLALPLRA